MIYLVNFLLLLALAGFATANKHKVCSSYDDPHMTTFDGSNYEFQYTGDHYVLYDDFKDTRVSASYQPCGPNSKATCNCAVYLKKGRKITFVDFCSTTNPASPTSQLYGVDLEKGAIGLKAIKPMPQCDVIASKFEDNKDAWDNITTFLDDFKCARVQGSNYYDLFVIRTVEKDFEDSVKIKFKLASRTMPTLEIKPSLSSYENTGGLCGMWDDDRQKELYVLDEDGVEKYLPNLNDVEVAREFWRLSSRYNKDYFKSKRCPECYLMSERSFYCPCDDFDMYDDENYMLDSPPSRSTYCKVPMFRCIEKYNNINETLPEITTTESPISTTTKKPITEIEAELICKEALLNHPALKPLIDNGCFDPNTTITICAIDVFLTGDESLINLHIQTSIDEAIQNILNGLSNCTTDFLITLCPNNCSSNGVCEINSACLIPGRAIFDEDCLAPVKCNCRHPWGGIDCSTDLLVLPEINLDRSCCSLRNDQCGRVNGFGYPFSKRDKIYARIVLIEENQSGENKISDNVVATTLSENNIVMNINKLKELSLYKNIFNQTTPNQFKPSQSVARAFFYISYSLNDTLTMEKPTTSFTLYDSRCRECVNKETQILDDKCDIEGICYFENDNKPNDEELFCIPEENQIDWTYKPSTIATTPSEETCGGGTHYWSQWYNIDSPDGDGDLELTELRKIGCKEPSGFEVQTVDGIPYDKTNQTTHLKDCMGFMCLNRENNAECFDYKIRKCCPITETTTSTTEEPTTTTEEPTTTTEEPTTTTEEPTTTTEEPTTTTTTTEEPTTVIPCDISLLIAGGLINKDNIFLWTYENATFLAVNFQIVTNPRNADCVVIDTLKITAKTKGYTAKNNVNYRDEMDTIILNNNDRDESFFVDLIIEKGVTPFKFFGIELKVESKLNITYEYREEIIVYIEDVDYVSGTTINRLGTYDILSFDIARNDISVAFISNSGSFVNLTANPYELCPFKNGITSNYDRLKIKLEYLGNDYLKLHTLEVHNKERCNLKTANIRLLDFSQKPYTDYIKSNRIFSRPVIDLDLYTMFYNQNIGKNLIEIVEINWLDTIDGKNPGKCELRAFVEKTK